MTCGVAAPSIPPSTDCPPPFLPPIRPTPDMPDTRLSYTTRRLVRTCCGGLTKRKKCPEDYKKTSRFSIFPFPFFPVNAFIQKTVLVEIRKGVRIICSRDHFNLNPKVKCSFKCASDRTSTPNQL